MSADERTGLAVEPLKSEEEDMWYIMKPRTGCFEALCEPAL